MQHFVPVELADIILHHAEYYATFTVVMKEPQTVADGHALCARSFVLTQGKLQSLVKVRVVVKGHDQGWSSYPEDHGTKRNSWTWYTMNIFDKSATPRCGADDTRLATNAHASLQTQTHTFEWTREDAFFQRLIAGQQLCLWAHARYVYSTLFCQ